MTQKLMTSAKLLLSAGAALSVTACMTVPPPNVDHTPSPTHADDHAIQVDETAQELEIPVETGVTALTPEARAQVTRFGGLYARVGHGPLTLSAPSGADNADAAARIANETRMRLAEAGVPYEAIIGSTYDASGEESTPIILSFTNYEATAPDCAPMWRQDMAHQQDNQAYESFGCAGQANLAALVEDPHDLIAPRDEDPRDAARRSDVLQAYRRGESTAVVRTQDERVAISNAVQ